MESDRFLVARARGGDVHAFAALLARHRPALLRAARDELTRDGELPDRAADPREQPPERLLAGERAAELAGAIGALPRGQRDAVVLFHLGGLPQHAVADRLGTGGGAVRTRLHKARAAMRARLTPPERTRMLPATIADIRRTPAGRHVVLLATGDDRLPIWIGRPEAEALAAGLHQVELPRPSAHALALSLVQATGPPSRACASSSWTPRRSTSRSCSTTAARWTRGPATRSRWRSPRALRSRSTPR